VHRYLLGAVDSILDLSALKLLGTHEKKPAKKAGYERRTQTQQLPPSQVPQR
jgi:hypothetical protein